MTMKEFMERLKLRPQPAVAAASKQEFREQAALRVKRGVELLTEYDLEWREAAFGFDFGDPCNCVLSRVAGRPFGLAYARLVHHIGSFSPCDCGLDVRDADVRRFGEVFTHRTMTELWNEAIGPLPEAAA